MGKRILLLASVLSVISVLGGCGGGALAGLAAALAGGGGGSGGGSGASPAAPAPSPAAPPPSPAPEPVEEPPETAGTAFDIGAIEDLVRGPDGTTFYLSDWWKKQLLELKPHQGTLKVLRTLTFQPGDIDISPDGKALYAVVKNENLIARVNPASGALSYVYLPGPAADIACDYDRVYVTTRSGPAPYTYTLEIYDPATGAQTTITKWTGDRIAIDRLNRRLFVAPTEYDSLLRSYSLSSPIPTLIQERLVVAQNIFGARLSPSGDTVTVRGRHGLSLYKPGFSTSGMPELTAKDIADFPGHYDSGSQPFDIAYHPNGKEAVTSSWSLYANFLWVHDTGTHERLRKIDLTPWIDPWTTSAPSQPLLEFSSDGKILVVATRKNDSNFKGKIILVYPKWGWEVILPYTTKLPYADTISAGAVSDLVSSLDGTEMYATDFKYNRVVAVDALTNQVKWSMPVGSQPVAADLDPSGRWLWVATHGATRLSQVDLLTKEVHSVRVSGLPEDIAVGGDGLAYASAKGLKGPVICRVNTFGGFEVDAPEFSGKPLVIDRAKNKLFTVDGLTGKVARYGLTGGGITLEQAVSPDYTGGLGIQSIVLSPEGISLLFPPLPHEYDSSDLATKKGTFSGTVRFAAFSPDGNRVYITDSLGSPTSVVVHDRATHKIIDYLPLTYTSSNDQKFTMGITASGSRIYVFSRGTSEDSDGYLQWVDP